MYLALSTGGDDTARQQWESQTLNSGPFYAVSRFHAIEGQPEPPTWLEIFETGAPQPLTALPPAPNDQRIHFETTGAYQLLS